MKYLLPNDIILACQLAEIPYDGEVVGNNTAPATY